MQEILGREWGWRAPFWGVAVTLVKALGIVSKHCLCCSSLGKLRPEGKKCFLSCSFLASHPQLMVEGSLVHQVPLHWRSSAQLADLPPPSAVRSRMVLLGGSSPICTSLPCHLPTPAVQRSCLQSASRAEVTNIDTKAGLWARFSCKPVSGHFLLSWFGTGAL